MILSHLVINLIRGYQIIISPILHSLGTPHACRYHPTCSQYTINSIQKLGLLPGLRAGLSQFLTCHPYASTNPKQA